MKKIQNLRRTLFWIKSNRMQKREDSEKCSPSEMYQGSTLSFDQCKFLGYIGAGAKQYPIIKK